MNELTLFEKLKEAYEISTHNNNRFLKLINSIKWDSKFYADGEHVFNKGSLSFATPSLDPFECTKDWKPSAIFMNDGSYISF